MIIKHKMKFMLVVCVIVVSSFNECESKGRIRGFKFPKKWFSFGGTKSKVSKPQTAPYEPPLSYPGLHNRPVYSHTNYQSRNNNLFSNSSSGGYGGGYGGSNVRSSGGSYVRVSDGSYVEGSGGGFGGNTFTNNYRGGDRRLSIGSSFLTYGLLYGHSMGRSSSRSWDDVEDRRWRATTKAPYFENKQPGSESVLPAAAVLGAATAFGIYSLLPLNVPNGKPILSCNATELQQTQINFNGSTYGCSNKTITVACFKVDPITYATLDFCPGQTLECDKTSEVSSISCTNGILLSSEPIFCNSTTILNELNASDTTKILNCYSGVLPTNIASSIPTKPPMTTTENPKSLSIGAKVHSFLLWTLGKSDVLDMKLPTTTPAPDSFVPRFLSDSDTIAFIPIAVNETIIDDITTTVKPKKFRPRFFSQKDKISKASNESSLEYYVKLLDMLQSSNSLTQIKAISTLEQLPNSYNTKNHDQ